MVVDASAMVAALVGHTAGDRLLEALSGELAAPHLLDIEVMSALRGLERAEKLSAESAVAAKASYFEFSILRYETEPLAGRIWSLRYQFATYDASYVALAEGLDAPLVTCDKKLAAGGHAAHVVLC